MSGRFVTANRGEGEGGTSRILSIIVFATVGLVCLGLIIGILVTVLDIQGDTDDIGSFLEEALATITASFANIQIALASLETTLNFLVSSSQDHAEDHDDILIAINNLELEHDWFCPNGLPSSYSAIITGSGATASSSISGNTTTGLFEIGWDKPLHWIRTPCGDVSGTLNVRATFTTDEDCDDLDDEECPRQFTKQYARLECMEVESTNDGDVVWFSAQLISANDDPRLLEYDQYMYRGIKDRIVMFGRIAEPSMGPNVRSLLTSAVMQLHEGIDNTAVPIGEISGVSLSSCAGYEADNFCALKDDMFTGQADFIMLCEDEEHVCSFDDSIVGCQLPNVSPDNIGGALDTSLPCWIEATAFQWLDEFGEPYGPVYKNNIANTCNPPDWALYSLADITRTFASGHITITSTD